MECILFYTPMDVSAFYLSCDNAGSLSSSEEIVLISIRSQEFVVFNKTKFLKKELVGTRGFELAVN